MRNFGPQMQFSSTYQEHPKEANILGRSVLAAAEKLQEGTAKVSARDAHDAMIYKNGILDYDAHDAYLRSLGYEYLALPCTCGGSEEDGHLPSCGWGIHAQAFTTYHPQRGGNSNGLHVTQGSAPESGRHSACSGLDGTQKRNGCVAQMDMPRTDAATADGSSTSAEIKVSCGTVEGHGRDLGGKAAGCVTENRHSTHSMPVSGVANPQRNLASGYQAPPAGIVLPESELRTQRELPTATTSPANRDSSGHGVQGEPVTGNLFGPQETAAGIPFQYSPTTEASGLGATASAKAGSYGESASCTETAGAEIPTEYRTLSVREECMRQNGGSTGAQEGPSVASPTHIGVDAGIEGKGDDCQSPFMTFDEEYGRTYKGRIYSREMIEDLIGTVMRAERGKLR